MAYDLSVFAKEGAAALSNTALISSALASHPDINGPCEITLINERHPDQDGRIFFATVKLPTGERELRLAYAALVRLALDRNVGVFDLQSGDEIDLINTSAVPPFMHNAPAAHASPPRIDIARTDGSLKTGLVFGISLLITVFSVRKLINGNVGSGLAGLVLFGSYVGFSTYRFFKRR